LKNIFTKIDIIILGAMKEFLFNFVFYPIIILTILGVAIYILYVVFDFSACAVCLEKINQFISIFK